MTTLDAWRWSLLGGGLCFEVLCLLMLSNGCCSQVGLYLWVCFSYVLLYGLVGFWSLVIPTCTTPFMLFCNCQGGWQHLWSIFGRQIMGDFQSHCTQEHASLKSFSLKVSLLMPFSHNEGDGGGIGIARTSSLAHGEWESFLMCIITSILEHRYDHP